MNFMKRQDRQSHYFIPCEKNRAAFSHLLNRHVLFLKKERENLILLCIGTDKITGDCLGPLVGTNLKDYGCPLPIYGTLKSPVHAGNLPAVLPEIYRNHPCPFLLVIDAAVGAKRRVGQVSLSCRPLCPGRGVARPLPPVGNISVTGIVSEAAADSEFLLPYTSFYLVNNLAKYISDGIMETDLFRRQS